MEKLYAGIAVILILHITGCAAPIWSGTPSSRTVENEYYSAKVTPNCDKNSGCKYFTLNISNKTNKEFEIDWNRTQYIKGNQTLRGFFFEGIKYMERNNKKNPDTVFANSSLQKDIYPTDLVTYVSGEPGEWGHSKMGSGTHGVYLAVIVDGNKISESITIDIGYMLEK